MEVVKSSQRWIYLQRPPRSSKFYKSRELTYRGVHQKCTFSSNAKAQTGEDTPHWYALRCTYGREKKVYDYMTAKGITAFYPTINSVKLINGKRKVVTESRLPNIFFAYGTEEQLKTYVYDNVNLSFLRFYYRHVHIGRRIEKTPLIVPDYQMKSLKIACTSEEDDVIIVSEEIQKFEKGQLVRVVKGEFKGFVGRVAVIKDSSEWVL